MVIGDNDIHTELPRASDRLDIGDARVHVDDERHPALRELLYPTLIHAVALEVAMRDVVLEGGIYLAQEVVHDDPTWPPVAVVVAPDSDMLTVLDSAREPLGGSRHVRHQKR